jgi:hypothetical protein
MVLAMAVMPVWALSLYQDTLTWSSGGITATPTWNDDDTSLSWDIVNLGNGYWDYTYTWNTQYKDLSHILIELSEGATLSSEEFWDWSGNINWAGSGVDDWTEQQGNPGIPGSLFGLKVDPTPDTTSFTFSFTTWHSPVWGDFYAKDGKVAGSDTLAYNSGFLLADANDGLHIARPNGRTPNTSIPDGGLTAVLLGISLLGVEALRRRLHKRA